MKSLLLPANEATQKLEQAFHLVFDSTAHDYIRLCHKFAPLGGLPRTWLVKGESGTGKSYLANILCRKHGVDQVLTIAIGDLAIMYPGDLLKGLTTYFESIKQFSKTVGRVKLSAMIHKELRKQESVSATSVTAEASHFRVLVLGLTQDSHAIDPSVATVFDDSIEIDIPTPEERAVILQACAFNHQMIGQPRFALTLEAASLKCHGYLPADLDALCTQAAIIAYRHGRAPDSCTKQDFFDGIKAIRVSALRQNTSVQKVEPVYWSDIGGLENVKLDIALYACPNLYLIIAPAFLCRYGPPGTGKTLLAKAVATESEANFMAVSIPELIKGEVGESEKAISKVFKAASRCSPCIIFLDELEALFGTRESSGGLGKQV
ncbi:spermatogenesis associated protein 5 [Linnemannia zychae]|nr:spermatogenesis associated protein 5 [Linnemannia zychae]